MPSAYSVGLPIKVSAEAVENSHTTRRSNVAGGLVDGPGQLLVLAIHEPC